MVEMAEAYGWVNGLGLGKKTSVHTVGRHGRGNSANILKDICTIHQNKQNQDICYLAQMY